MSECESGTRGAAGSEPRSETDAQPLLRAAVVGGGVMGAGIAHVIAAAGVAVTLCDPIADVLPQALQRIERMARQLNQDPAAIAARLHTTSSMPDAVAGASIVIEAGPEVLTVKQAIFSELTEHASAAAVLTSNTSAIPISEIATGLPLAGRIVGTHFWNPPQLVPLVEVVKAEHSDREALDWTEAFLKSVAMEPVRVNADVPGFVGNRLQHALKREAIALVAQGVCDAETLDTVVRSGFGLRLGVLGPLEQADLGGLELTYKIHQVVMPALDNTPVPHPYLLEKVAAGEVGASVSKGFREWAPGEAERRREQVDAFLVDAAERRTVVSAPAPPSRVA